MKNGCIKDGEAYQGAGIYSDGGNVRLEGVTIHGCKADGWRSSPDYQGGGVYVRNGGSLTMINSVINDCLSDDWGGGLYIDGSTCTMEGSTIQECKADDHEGGGVYLLNSKLTMKDSKILKCKAEDNDHGEGGGIYSKYSSIKMTNSQIKECTCDHRGGGGIILWQDSDLTMDGGSIIASCSASGCGGGVHLYTNSEFFMTDSEIKDCKVDGGEALGMYHGGGVFVDSGCTFEMVRSKISDCYSDDDGGGVFVEYSSSDSFGKFHMTESIIQNCKTDDDNGGGVYTEGDTTITNSSILNCIANSLGGGIYINYPYGTPRDVIMEDTIIADCTAKQGGGVYIEGGAKFIMNSGVIKNCKASEDGGGVFNDFDMDFVSPRYGEFTMNGGSIIDCSAGDGDAFYNDLRCDFNFKHGIFNKWNTLHMNMLSPDYIGSEPDKKVKLIYGDKEYYQYWRCDDTYLDSCPFTAPDGTIFSGWAKSKDGPVVYKDKEKFNFDTDTLYPVFCNIAESAKYDYSSYSPSTSHVIETPDWWLFY